MSLTLVVAVALGFSAAGAGPAQAAITRAFAPVFTANTNGDILLRGNTLLTCAPGSVSTLAAATPCASAQTGTVGQNNYFPMSYVDVDTDATTFDSSSATVTVPAGATVLYAGLSWGANTSAGVNGVATATPASKGTVLLKSPTDTAYTTVTSTLNDGGAAYQGYARVTDAVAAAGSGTYTVANVQAGTGQDRWAGWSLVIAYRDPTQPSRNLVVYTGFGTVTGTGTDASVDIPVTGFTTPSSGSVVTRLGVVAYEGDRGATGDGMKLGATAMTNSLNPVDDVFNSTVTDLGTAVTNRTPSYRNLLGFDIDRFDATGVLGNGATQTTINLNTSGETYYPGVITFATELYAPSLTATKTVTDVNGGNAAPGDVLRYSVTVASVGDENATSAILTDAVPAGTAYVAGSLVIGGAAVTDAAGDDQGNVSGATVTARLGTGATSSAGGQLTKGATTSVVFQVRVDAGAQDGAVVSNLATMGYNSQATGTAFTGGSNTVTSTVVVPPVLTFAAPPAGRIGVPYSDQLTRTGGTGPYVWSVSAGTLPPGLSLNGATGLLSGTPTTAGSFGFTVRIVDVNGRLDTTAVTLLVARVTTTLALTTSSPTVNFGTPVTLTGNLSPGSPSGPVTFTDVPTTGPLLGTTVALGGGTAAGGVATLSTTLPAFGRNVITATYGGDATHSAATSTTVAVEVTAYAGELIVTEFRSSGPAGAQDSYVELYNTGPTVPMAGIVLAAGSGSTTVLPADAGSLGTGRSYLVTGSAFSLGGFATGDTVASLGTDGVAVRAPDTAGTRTDAVGPNAGLHLGDGVPAMTGTPTDQYAWVRAEVAGRPQNSSDNASDFRLVSATGGVVGGLQSTLGSASPTGSTDPFQHNATVSSSLFDLDAGQNTPANRVYVVGAPGRLVVRRTLTNTSGDAITTAKLRITALSEANGAPSPGATQPARKANLRLVNPTTATSSVLRTNGTTATVANLSVDAPVNPAPGGGLNTTLTVPLPGGLAAGDSVSVAFTFAVDTRGSYWFGFDVDALGAGAGPNPAARVLRVRRTDTLAVSAPSGRLLGTSSRRTARLERRR